MRKLTQQEFEDRARLKNQLVTVTGTYNGDDTKVECRCNFCGATLWIKPFNIYAGRGCYSCSKQRVADSQRKTTEQFRAELSEKQPNIVVTGEYTGANRKIQCVCSIHQSAFDSTPTHLLSGETGCPFCIKEKAHKAKATTDEQYREKLSVVSPDVELLAPFVDMRTKVHVRCKTCGFVWDANPAALLVAHGCRRCYRSVGERLIQEWLDENGVEYQCQKKFPTLLRGVNNRSPLSYDFYLPEYRTLIEYQGQYHDGTAWKGKLSAKDTQVQQDNDNKKRAFARQNNYNMIEIWYYQRDQIPDILSGLVN